jgi:hypothetical protein|tara:strand:- start:263 stop:811 length:549 start_codon:yes stop_codon:yes gene_type:complete
MDFHLVSSTLLKEFDEHGIRYAIIGGFALGLWEVTRATIDMDFLLLINDLPQAEAILSKFSYRQTYKSENVAQYVSDLAPYGQIDLLFAFRKVSRRMLERRVRKSLGNDFQAHTLLPEDLIGLKLQAMVNDPSREPQELVDISSLLNARKRKNQAIDWDLLEEYFALFSRQKQLDQLKQTHG